MLRRSLLGIPGCGRWVGGLCVVTFADSAGSGDVLVEQRHQDIHIVDGEEARVAVQHPLIPVVIDLIGQGDDVALFEA